MCWGLVLERQQSFSFQTFLGSHAGARWGLKGGGGGREGVGVGGGGGIMSASTMPHRHGRTGTLNIY